MHERDDAEGVPDLTALVQWLADLDRSVPDAVRVDRIRVLEAVKAAASAPQAR